MTKQMDPRAQLYDFPSKDLYKLEAMRSAAKSLGEPQLGRRSVLVAGTNGKGSVCSFLTHLFMGSGRQVGSYYSPHVVSETERIQLNAKNIEQEAFDRLLKKYDQTLSKLTYFEKMTVASFLFFKEASVDVQVLEVGMGGRLDATNICEPDISVITALGLDHQEVLGESLQKIAFEKSGIMRAGKKCFSLLPESIEAADEIRSSADRLDAELCFENEFSLPEKIELQIKNELQGLPDFQLQNARLAAKVYLKACESWGWTRAFEKGVFRKALLKGRTQIVSVDPPQILDGGHNLQAVQGLRRFLESNYAEQKFVGVFGGMKERPLEQLALEVEPWISELYLVSFFKPRECPPDELKERLQTIFKPQIKVAESLRGLKKMLKNKPVLCFGSFYLLGEWLDDEN